METHRIDPHNLYNFDETGFCLRQGSSHAVVTVYKHKRSPTAQGENITAVECISADGFILDPLFILKGEH